MRSPSEQKHAGHDEGLPVERMFQLGGNSLQSLLSMP